jgi:ribosomal protein S6
MVEEPRSQAEHTQAEENDSRHVYEIGFHLVPTVEEGDVSGVADKIRALVGDAEIIKTEAPRKMTLAYTIERSVQGKREKYTESYFGFIKFAAEPANIPALQAALRAMSEVLRFIVVETVREEAVATRRAVFSSDRLEGQTLKKPTSAPEAHAEVSEEELEKSLEALTN